MEAIELNYPKERIEQVKIGDFYFVVEDINKSVNFYTKLLFKYVGHGSKYD